VVVNTNDRAPAHVHCRAGGQWVIVALEPEVAVPGRTAMPEGTLGRMLDPKQALAALHQEIMACRRCALAGYHVEGTPVLGGTVDMLDRARRVMLIGQAPGRVEAGSGRPFSGPAGKRLFGWLAGVGVAEHTFRRQVYMAAMTRCYPGPSPSGHGDRRPSAEELALCRGFLDRQLNLIRPELVLLVGGLAIEAFLGKLKLDQAVGKLHPKGGVCYLALPHPSGASTWLNQPAHQTLLRRSLDLLRESGLIRPDAGDGGGAHGLPAAGECLPATRR
jgi:uracil-DNA glycosylase